ncbi:hypothetical protein [Calidithermus timidus]|uniref:hypothetical protein n=1 Tax=Calidithermus timidus TaxID=307124 RepID=UPI000361C730|nr:hypothetical protein [Calidithermus timidus]
MGGLEVIQGLILVAAEAQATPDPAATRAVRSVVGVVSILAGATVGVLLGAALHDVGAARGVLIGMAGGALGGLLSGVLSTTGEATA